MSRSSFLVFALALPLVAQVKITQGTDRISVEIGGKPFTDFFVSADVNKPYLHPLRSATGKVITRHFPMELVEGETRDHPHHRGLWFTHGDVNGLDFWANETRGGNKGRVVLKKVVDLKSGKKEGLIATTFDWLDPNGKPLLTESRRMVFFGDDSIRMIDFDIALTAVEKVKFGDTKEGTFAIRLTPPLEEPGKRDPAKYTGKMITAEGRETEANVWGTRSPWVDYSGEVGGEPLGITIMDHPSNPRHPTYWHSRGYGLFAANMFGVRDFERDKTKDGSLTLEPNQRLRVRYRVLIHPGRTAAAEIPALFTKYAKTK
ncbi:MAG TPA: PmoA family protein [Bryobacteraceae bacterium]|nr:PmoA family protein [Bryobacteraceae bacterium]